MKIAIIGGGIAGLTTAIALNKYGIEATVFEAARQLEPVGAGLGLGSNALKAFDWLNLAVEVQQAGRLLPSFTIFDQQGKQISKTDSQSSRSFQNFTIHRSALQDLLLSKLNSTTIQLNKRAVDVTQTGDGVTVDFQDGTSYIADLLIVADGIHSSIRNKILPGVQPRYAGYTCWRAVINNRDLHIRETSETWGTNGRFGIVPLNNNELYWFACINAPQHDPMMKSFGINDLQTQFKNYHSPISSILSNSNNEQLLWNDIIDLAPLSRYAFGRILLLGDAAHATTPNMGQGACQAIEDAVVIAQCIHENADYSIAFKKFEERRLKRTHWITNTSQQIGALAQLDNNLLVGLRNFVLRLIPPRFNEIQLNKISTVDFIR